MRVIIESVENGKNMRFVYDLYDEFDKENNILSMARTTGYTCTAIATLVANGKYTHKGLSPAEYLGKSKDDFYSILKYLEERNVIYKVKKEAL